jgi:hypothetical protein
MRSLLVCASIVGAALMLGGCATSQPVGWGVTQVKLPQAVGDGAVKQGMKKGVSECKSYLAIVAAGDASIEAAAKNGGITKIQFVDWEADNILGIIGTYKCTVYGE